MLKCCAVLLAVSVLPLCPTRAYGQSSGPPFVELLLRMEQLDLQRSQLDAQRAQRSGDGVDKTRERIFRLYVPADMGVPNAVEMRGMRVSGYIGVAVMKSVIARPLNGRTRREPQSDCQSFQPFGQP